MIKVGEKLRDKEVVSRIQNFCTYNKYKNSDDVLKEASLIRAKRSLKTNKMRNLTLRVEQLIKSEKIELNNGRVTVIEDTKKPETVEPPNEPMQPKDSEPEESDEPEEDNSKFLLKLSDEEIQKMNRSEIKNFIDRCNLDITVGNSSVTKLRKDMIDLRNNMQVNSTV